jgi:hypothetical protein
MTERTRAAARGGIAHDVSKNGRKHRNAMLLLTVDPDDRALALAFRPVRGEQRHRHLAYMHGNDPVMPFAQSILSRQKPAAVRHNKFRGRCPVWVNSGNDD